LEARNSASKFQEVCELIYYPGFTIGGGIGEFGGVIATIYSVAVDAIWNFTVLPVQLLPPAKS
jgi:hypothetical protein